MSGAPADNPDLYDEETGITWKMVDAGVDRLRDLLEAGTGSAYVVSEVYLAMCQARSAAHQDVHDTAWKRCRLRAYRSVSTI